MGRARRWHTIGHDQTALVPPPQKGRSGVLSCRVAGALSTSTAGPLPSGIGPSPDPRWKKKSAGRRSAPYVIVPS
ncbi:hypothetical protein [Pandoravirus japonicus]|uniref:Uncharacterized protein n=1 Tax=Pandoravirus japonicus TaxID=2823154 RepID=A0A811BTE1_9VIRU|nr:hypothetical protein [Pandoravirus japonicus]